MSRTASTPEKPCPHGLGPRLRLTRGFAQGPASSPFPWCRLAGSHHSPALNGCFSAPCTRLSLHGAWEAFIPQIQIEDQPWVSPLPLQHLHPKPQAGSACRCVMDGVTRALLLLLAGLPVLEANDVIDKDSPFYYDWEGLQLGGMICAGLMCIAGILFALSGKCKCKNKQKHGSLPEKAVPLLTPGSASTC
ncbi:hypothetical protein R6Z07F_019174 [Ovis aries]